jgi:methylaspartate mutase epsilon subunit
MGVRDAQGTVRWLDTGNLPFTREILDFHREKLAERSKKEGKEIGYNELVKELITIGTGHLDID